ncbi:hypothetical protein L226DRAFT_566683 [Lentinus tigrinus ALCF2SS1-7]|uniref:ferric-chelate reductase (NADPH) n=1 Tax=Lentinus tigrinus ALCF2SS1-6 TaxID=1328759 RepID=A0A5C2SQT2_9APHY|nr:hypothetical protein L227DRAFT_570124 [Lentinus tigrinus ALCF2SS1-6]RPD80154.1 hypothetical protein L226DRAFT_566683 [Lentinus tigrinus ALCF2SS1-7]
MASTNSTSRPAYPAAPSFQNDLEFLYAYLAVHVLSDPSRVYSYILWIAIGAVLLFLSLLHHLHISGGYLGALWNKWALRRRTWRKKHSLAVAKARGEPHRQPYSLPANAQIFTLSIIVIASLLCSFLGPDYFAPKASLWTLNDYPWATTSPSLSKRYELADYYQYMPQYTIPKAWWTSGNRTGLIAFALFPLCILFALKSPPFAIFSISCLVQFYCDKLLWLHKWSARLIFFLTVLHVAFWSVQLLIESRNGKVAYFYAWSYQKFIFAWTAFGCMVMLFLLSIGPFRRKHYEAFWFLHVLFVPLTIIMSALHHPPVWWWCWAALGLWLGERTWRFTWWLYTNGYFGMKSTAPSNKLRKVQYRNKPPVASSGKMENAFPYPNALPTAGIAQYPPPNQLPGVGLSVPTDYVPPPGFAHAELLPGRTIRLRIVTPGYLTWAPGQHFLISVPSITRFTTHPFTTASICDEQNPYDDGRVLVFLIRAKNGWTKDLWDNVALMLSRGQQYVRSEFLPRCEMPSRGVLLRACVDGPYGSSIRASWGSYSTVLIVAGGSGVSYALSVLQYICLCLAGRNGRFLGGQSGGYGHPNFKTARVRFVWLVREFGHIQWCASVLRRCMDLLPGPELQIDIFVTNVKPVAGVKPPQPSRISFAPPPFKDKDGLEPPRPGFAVNSRPVSRASLDSEDSGDDSDVDLSYYTGYVQEDGGLGHEEDILDLTNFEGDDDSTMPGEAQFNLSVKQEGRSRRAISRRMSTALFAKQELLHRASQLDFDGTNSTVQLVNKRASLPPIETNAPPSIRPPSVDGPSSQRPSVDIASVRPGDSRRGSVQGPQTPWTPSPLTPNSAAPLISPDSSSSDLRRELPALHTRNISNAPANLTPKRFSALSERSLMQTPITPASQRSMSRLSQWTDTDSFAALVPRGDVETVREQLRLVLCEKEVEDVGIMAEHARPGKPKLERILADEVERAKGALAVACCGPTSLDAMIRKVVAAQIDPQRIKRGDMRGSIALFSEEFSY